MHLQLVLRLEGSRVHPENPHYHPQVADRPRVDIGSYVIHGNKQYIKRLHYICTCNGRLFGYPYRCTGWVLWQVGWWRGCSMTTSSLPTHRGRRPEPVCYPVIMTTESMRRPKRKFALSTRTALTWSRRRNDSATHPSRMSKATKHVSSFDCMQHFITNTTHIGHNELICIGSR